MHDFLNKRVLVSSAVTPTGANGPVAFTATGDKFILSRPNPFTLVRYGIIWNAAKDATAFIMNADLRITAGTDTGRVNDYVPALSDALARAAGVVVSKDVLGPNPNSSTGSDGSLVNVARGIIANVDPGQELVFEVTDAAVSGTGYIFAEIVEMDENGSRAALVVRL